MARPAKELHKTTIQNTKPAETDYKMMDGKGLFLLVKKMVPKYGGLGMSAQIQASRLI